MLDENKCIQHNYQNLEKDKMAFIKNLYTINCKIVTQSSTSSLQLEQIRTNIRKALYKNFNSRQMEFGENVSYDYIESTILGADTRIKNVILSELDFGTYAIYYSSGSSKTITNADGNTITVAEKSRYLAPGWRTVLISDELVGICDPFD